MATRKYTLRKRAQQQDETRRRIVQAVMELHEELGPAHTTVSAVAERAGVQRLTVYRHFADEASLLRACSSAWSVQHPAPNPSQWQDRHDPAERAGLALRSLYAYYRANQGMLASVGRDAPHVAAVREVLRESDAYLAGIASDLLVTWKVRGRARRPLRAVVRHALHFATWQSLAQQALSDAAIAQLMVAWMGAIARGRR